MCSVGVVILFLTLTEYSKSNATQSPASGAGNVSEPRLMLEVGRVRAAVFLQSKWCTCQYSSVYLALATT
jgi:hypothetical protein